MWETLSSDPQVPSRSVLQAVPPERPPYRPLTPQAERVGDTVRLTLDAYGTDGSPVTELPVDQVRRLVAGAQQDLQDFLSLAGTWAEQHLPVLAAAAVTAALARALDLAPTP